jgi:hypothetical protein
MPDWCKAIANIGLVNLRNGHFAQLGQNVKGQRAKPSACYPIALQFGLAAFKGILGNIFKGTSIFDCFRGNGIAGFA